MEADQIQIDGNHSLENYASEYEEDYQNDEVSDSESCISSDNDDNNSERLFGDNLMRVNEDGAIFDIIGHRFLSNLVENGKKKSRKVIEAIHKVNWSNSPRMVARYQCFNIFCIALLEKTNNDDNDDGVNKSCMKYGWYCDSKEGVERIVSHGFSHRELGNDHGISLSPVNSLAQSVKNCVVDDDGLKHVILCRVLLENGESFKELSPEVDDDDVTSPNMHIVWSTKMNTHILPEYVITFRLNPYLEGLSKDGQTWKKAADSPWIPFTTLISTLSKFLPPNTIILVKEHYKEYKARKISRHDLIKRLRRFVGDDLLIKIIRNCATKDSTKSLGN